MNEFLTESIYFDMGSSLDIKGDDFKDFAKDATDTCYPMVVFINGDKGLQSLSNLNQKAFDFYKQRNSQQKIRIDLNEMNSLSLEEKKKHFIYNTDMMVENSKIQQILLKTISNQSTPTQTSPDNTIKNSLENFTLSNEDVQTVQNKFKKLQIKSNCFNPGVSLPSNASTPKKHEVNNMHMPKPNWSHNESPPDESNLINELLQELQESRRINSKNRPNLHMPMAMNSFSLQRGQKLIITNSSSPLMPGGANNDNYISPLWAMEVKSKESFWMGDKNVRNQVRDAKKVKLKENIKQDAGIELQNFFGRIKEMCLD